MTATSRSYVWPRKTGQFFWSAVAVVCLLLIGWAAGRAVIDPYDGVYFQPTGMVFGVDARGPAYGRLEVGDILILLDGQPIGQIESLYAGKGPGDWVQVELRRDQFLVSTSFPLVSPPLREVFGREAVLAVALAFWLVGAGIIFFLPAYSQVASPMSRFFLFSALGLAAGEFSQQGPPWVIGVFYLCFWFIGPMALHFHLVFPQEIHFPGRRVFLSVLYAIAAAGGLPYLIFGKSRLSALSYYDELLFAGRLFMALNLLGVLGLLLFSFFFTYSSGARGTVRLIALGGGMSAGLFIGLTVLPTLIFDRVFVPFSIAALALAILPLTYGYVIFRQRLIEVERQVNRGVALFLTLAIIGLAYLLGYALLTVAVPATWINDPLTNAFFVILLAALFKPVRLGVQKVVDTAFYGGWYDYRSAVTSITAGLAQFNNLDPLGAAVIQRLVESLRLEQGSLYLRKLDGQFMVFRVSNRPGWKSEILVEHWPLSLQDLSFFLGRGELIERASIVAEELNTGRLTSGLAEILKNEQVNLWAPVINRREVIGLFALGRKFGGDVFSAEDYDILRTIARQLAPIIENIHLVERLRRQAADLEKRVTARTEELHQAKERVEAILAGVGDGVIVTDLALTIKTINEAFVRQTGFPEAEMQNQNFNYLLAEDTPASVLQEIQARLARAETWSGELSARRKTGDPFDVHVTFAPVRNQDRQIVGYVASLRDITQAKELERMKDRFVADVSHELRTPVGNISLYLELLETANPEKQEKYMHVLHDQNRLLINLVEDILRLSRLTTRRSKDLVIQNVDLNDLVISVARVMEPAAESKGLIFSSDLYAGELPLEGDQKHLERMLINLATNAIRYTKTGGVWFRTRREGEMGVVEVGDSGIGIADEDLPYLFDRFYRGKNVRQSQIHGTGLGLAIAKEIVDLHGGWIIAQGAPGGGSIFLTYLPIKASVTDEQQKRSETNPHLEVKL